MLVYHNCVQTATLFVVARHSCVEDSLQGFSERKSCDVVILIPSLPIL